METKEKDYLDRPADISVLASFECCFRKRIDDRQRRNSGKDHRNVELSRGDMYGVFYLLSAGLRCKEFRQARYSKN